MGNTKPSPLRVRAWCFTLNNWTVDEFEYLKTVLTEGPDKLVIGREVGESGTPHLQGYVRFVNKQTLSGLKKLNARAHWEPAKGTPEQNLKYCTKEDKEAFKRGFEKKKTFKDAMREKVLKKYDEVIWKPWQQGILDLIKEPADDRTINWVYEPEGNTGKTFLAKYIVLTRNTIIADGKKDNVFNQLNRMMEEDEHQPEVVILDIPRSSEGYVNYGVLEQLKGGMLYSGKYEGGMCIFEPVHVIVLANFKPDMDQFSQDRWNLIVIPDE